MHAAEGNIMIHVQLIRRAGFASLAVLFLAVPGRGQDTEKARLRVYLPAADAKLEIQGKMTTRTGTVRLFESPLLPVVIWRSRTPVSRL